MLCTKSESCQLIPLLPITALDYSITEIMAYLDEAILTISQWVFWPGTDIYLYKLLPSLGGAISRSSRERHTYEYEENGEQTSQQQKTVAQAQNIVVNWIINNL